MDYRKLLDQSYMFLHGECNSRLEFLSEYVFNFTTYDSAMGEGFAIKALEVCDSITSRTTFEYIKDEGNYMWFLLMCNLPFFSERIEWGTSIRGAWWRHTGITLDSCGLYEEDGEQVTDQLRFTGDEWVQFIKAVILFSESP